MNADELKRCLERIQAHQDTHRVRWSPAMAEEFARILAPLPFDAAWKELDRLVLEPTPISALSLHVATRRCRPSKPPRPEPPFTPASWQEVWEAMKASYFDVCHKGGRQLDPEVVSRLDLVSELLPYAERPSPGLAIKAYMWCLRPDWSSVARDLQLAKARKRQAEEPGQTAGEQPQPEEPPAAPPQAEPAEEADPFAEEFTEPEEWDF